MHLAKSIAKLIQSDPIATAQVKEHVSRDRILELFDIDTEEPALEAEDTIEGIQYAIDGVSDENLVAYLKTRFKKSELLELVA